MKLLLVGLASLCFAHTALADSLPDGWQGYSNDQTYRELNAWSGKPAIVLKTKATEGGDPNRDYGNIGSSFSAERYRGQRLRFSAMVRTDAIVHWGGLWMRVDAKPPPGQSQKTVGFDNMADRGIHGTSGWSHYEVVLDVPAEAESIHFGVVMRNGGTMWMAEPRIEAVANSVPVTGAGPKEPQLDLSR